MASTYKVTVKIEDKILKTLTAGNYSLCIQKYLSDSGATGPVANIVAAAIPPPNYSNETDFQWKNEYTMAATNTPYVEGGYLTQTRTVPLPISTTSGDAFILKDWANYNVIHGSPSAPKNGFAFQPGKAIPDPGASVVVYLKTVAAGGTTAADSPFYMSPFPCIGPSDNKLIPVDQVVVFFYRDAKSGSMISSSRAGFEQIINLTEEPEQSWKLSDDKVWAKEKK